MAVVRLRAALIALLLTAALVPARAAPPVAAQLEISFLLGYVEGSGCEFYRNGTWSNSQAAQAHLRDKYDYLVVRNQVDTAEQFIDRAATRSSISGLPYQVRCHGAATVSSQQWLRDELARLRGR